MRLKLLRLPSWVSYQKLNNINAWPTIWQRAVYWAGRQWYVVLRREWGGVWRVGIEWSAKWGTSVDVRLGSHVRIEVGCTGPLVVDMSGRVGHSVLGVSRP